MKTNTFFRSALAALLMLAAIATASAHDFEVDGFFYNKNSDGLSVSVTFKGDNYNSYSDEYFGSVTISEKVTYSGNTYSVTAIGDEAFRSCSGLTSVSIPNSITSIGDMAFRGCSGLTSVSIPNSVTSIGYYAFDNCSSLTSVTIPNSVTSIDYEAFYRTPFYNNMQDGIVYLGRVLYKYKGSMPDNTSIVIKDNTVSMSPKAIFGCGGLTSVTIPDSVTSIGSEAFYDTPFYNDLPDGVVYFGSVLYTFKGTMPDNTSIIIKDGTVSISPKAFCECTGLISVTIPNSVTSIGPSAFAFCSSLTSITIPSSVTFIGDNAFSGCLIDWIYYNATNCLLNDSFNSGWANKKYTFVVGKNVEKISGKIASSSIQSPTTIITQAKKPPIIDQYTFSNGIYSAPLYVPNGSYIEYCLTDNWTEFTNMIEVTKLTTSIVLNKESINIDLNSTAKLTAIFYPTDATLRYVYWETDNSSIAAIDQTGHVTGVTSGSTIITATTIDGSNLKATCKVIVGNSGVDGVDASEVKVIARDGMINVTGVVPEARIEVYNVAGMCIYSGTNHEVPVAQCGIYIVKTQGKATKVAL